jgi:hypothetical protein
MTHNDLELETDKREIEGVKRNYVFCDLPLRGELEVCGSGLDPKGLLESGSETYRRRWDDPSSKERRARNVETT